MDLKGKKVIITGASKGLGEVCAYTLAKEGAQLVLSARTFEKLEEVRKKCKNPEIHLSLAADLTNPLSIKDFVNKAKDFLKDIDIVLHIAGGGLGLRDPFLSSSDLEKLLALNLKAAVELNHHILPMMVHRKRGNLVHVCSIASMEAVASVGYNTAKAAFAAYVRSLGREVAGSGVVVTGILPGGFYAPGNSWERLSANKPEVVEKFIQERLPRGFLGKAEELLPLILFLCSEQASMMGGCLVPIDAGEGRSYIH